MSVSSNSTDPVQSTIDLLDGYTGWSLQTPEVHHVAEVSQQDRENNPNPAIYVWSPLDGSMEGLGAKREKTIQTDTVEATIWVLDDADTDAKDDIATYHAETINFLEDYVTDNYDNIEFHNIRPDVESDIRNEKVARRTDHYVMSVQAEITNLRDSGT